MTTTKHGAQRAEDEPESFTDWSRWRKCPVCSAELNQPCVELRAFRNTHRKVEEAVLSRREPHTGRRPRTSSTPRVGLDGPSSGGAG